MPRWPFPPGSSKRNGAAPPTPNSPPIGRTLSLILSRWPATPSCAARPLNPNGVASERFNSVPITLLLTLILILILILIVPPPLLPISSFGIRHSPLPPSGPGGPIWLRTFWIGIAAWPTCSHRNLKHRKSFAAAHG